MVDLEEDKAPSPQTLQQILLHSVLTLHGKIGWAFFILGFLLWAYFSVLTAGARGLDGQPDGYADLGGCSRRLEKIYAMDRVIPAGGRTTIHSVLTQPYLDLSCPDPVTLALSGEGLEILKPVQEMSMIEKGRWSGGAWVVSASKAGIYKVTVSDGEHELSYGIAVYPSVAGWQPDYDMVKMIYLLLLLVGLLMASWRKTPVM